MLYFPDTLFGNRRDYTVSVDPIDIRELATA